MRGVAAFGCGLIVAVSVAVGVPMVWMEQNFVDKEGFADLAEPLRQDQSFLNVLNAAMAREATSDIAAAPALAPVIEKAVMAAARSLESDPGFPSAWRQTLIRSHELTFIDPYANASDSEVFNLDVTPLLQLVSDKVMQTVGQSIAIPKQVILPFGNKQHRKELAELGEVVLWGKWLVALAVIALVACVVLAKSRALALVFLGAGVAVTAGLWKIYLESLNQNLGAGLKGNALGDLFAEQLVVLISDSFGRWIFIALICGAGMTAAGLVTLALRGTYTRLRSPAGTRGEPA